MARKFWVDKKRLKDPMFWFMKAWAYSSTCVFIWKEFLKVASPIENPELAINSIRATPYLTGLACELFMKGYLIFKGELHSKVIRLKHDLKALREECAKFGDIRFTDDNLKFLTDVCGEQLMENGGIRYPYTHEMPVFPEFKKALNILQEISGEVDSLIVKKTNQS